MLKPEYNVLSVAGNTTGFKHSTASKEKMKIARSKREISEVTKQMMRQARKGSKLSLQAVDKLKRRVYTEEHRARISAALKGRQVSEKTLNRLRTVSCLKVKIKDLETNKIEYYPSITLAAKAIGTNRFSASKFIKANKLFKGRYLMELA